MNEAALKAVLNGSSNIVFFGGAGTSTESGIPDFRSDSGLYRSIAGGTYTPETILSRSFFMAHPDLFYEFYKSKMVHRHAKPNDAHYALAELERRGRLQAIITQNIDGLHQQAGSRNVLELHGSVHRNTCVSCGQGYTLDDVMNSDGIVPKCARCGGIVKPDVVLYEEPLHMEIWEKAADYVARADVLMVGGTSLTVYPAAGLIRYYNGDKLVIINRTPTPFDTYAKWVIRDSIGKVLRRLVLED